MLVRVCTQIDMEAKNNCWRMVDFSMTHGLLKKKHIFAPTAK